MTEIIVLSIFIVVYIFIVLERHHKAVVAMIGGTTIMLLVFKDPLEALVKYVDFNTLFLLVGMMVLVAVVKRSGFFHFLGLYALKLSKGNILVLYFILNVFVGILSSFLDNVTTILVAVPISFAICDVADLDPTLFVVSEVVSSNIGGTATLIGDPPNIMIGSAAGLAFTDFVYHLAPAVFPTLLAVLGLLAVVYRKEIFRKLPEEIVRGFEPKKAIVDKRLFYISVSLILVAVVLFSLQKTLNLESFEIALLVGFFSLIFLKKEEVEEVLREVEWGTLFFFIGLFLVVGALEETGIVDKIAIFLKALSGTSLDRSLIAVLVFSGVLSAFIGSVPFTATMIPVVRRLVEVVPISSSGPHPLWWALSLGACLGANGTLIGGQANMVGISLLQGRGKNISFIQFLKVGFPIAILSLLLSIPYLVLRY